MNWRLALLRRSLVPGLKPRMLNELAGVTAEGFGTAAPAWPGRTFPARLEEYARFTAHQADLLAAAGDVAATEAAKERLRAAALQLGTSLRRTLRIRSAEEALEALVILYDRIGIEMRSEVPGEISVVRCFFAGFYSANVCRVIEALDQGVVSGLFGGATFEFTERLTEGRPKCRACLRLTEAGA